MTRTPISLVLTTLILLAGGAFAGTWLPSTGGDWNTNTNWSDSTVPAEAGATATLDNDLGGETIDLSAPVIIGTLNVVNSFVTASDSLTFSGEAMTFNNNGTGASLSLWSATSQRRNLVFAGNIKLDDDLLISHAATTGSGVDISGNISGTGGLQSSGSYNLTLGGDNSGWSGDLSCAGSSRIIYDLAACLGDGTGTLNSGTFYRNVANTVTLNHALDVGTGSVGLMNHVTATSPRTILTTDSITGTSGKILINVGGGWGNADFFTEFTGNFNYTASGGIELASSTVDRRNTLLFNNASGTQSLVKVTGDGDVVRGTGAGTTIITDDSTYGGTTTVQGGTLLINGTHDDGTGGKAGNYTVEGGTLGGTGTITADVAVQSAGALSAGEAVDTLTLTVLGDVDLDGTLLTELDSAGNTDLLAVDGLFDITGGTLSLSRLGGGVYDPDQAYVIATYGTRSGTFAAIQGRYLSIDYDYNGNSIAVYIPEPSTGLLVLLSTVGLLARRRVLTERTS